jgi:hypothetical protein
MKKSDLVVSETCCMDWCRFPACAHGICIYHLWAIPCRGCGAPASHTWAGEESDLPGDIVILCDKCWEEFEEDESLDGVLSVGGIGGFMLVRNE